MGRLVDHLCIFVFLTLSVFWCFLSQLWFVLMHLQASVNWTLPLSFIQILAGIIGKDFVLGFFSSVWRTGISGLMGHDHVWAGELCIMGQEKIDVANEWCNEMGAATLEEACQVWCNIATVFESFAAEISWFTVVLAGHWKQRRTRWFSRRKFNLDSWREALLCTRWTA